MHPKPVSNDTLLQQLRRRYATKAVVAAAAGYRSAQDK
jgi:hypothetical protein